MPNVQYLKYLGVFLFIVMISFRNIDSSFLYLLLIIFLAIFPRLHQFIEEKYNFQLNKKSEISVWIDNLSILSEDGYLNKYYSIYIGKTNNSNWLYKLAIIMNILYFANMLVIAIIFGNNISTINSIYLQIYFVIIVFLTTIMFSYHYSKSKNSIIHALASTIILFILAFSCYIAFLILFTVFIFKIMIYTITTYILKRRPRNLID